MKLFIQTVNKAALVFSQSLFMLYFFNFVLCSELVGNQTFSRHVYRRKPTPLCAVRLNFSRLPSSVSVIVCLDQILPDNILPNPWVWAIKTVAQVIFCVPPSSPGRSVHMVIHCILTHFMVPLYGMGFKYLLRNHHIGREIVQVKENILVPL